VDAHLYPLRRELAKGKNPADPILQLDPLNQQLIDTSWELSIELNDVALLKPEGGVGSSKGQIAIICKKY
jgi:hypothetical protein